MHVYICVYIMYSSLIPILMPFFWVLLGLSLSREQERTLHSRCSLTSARQKESSFPLTTGSILVNKALSVASGITSRTYSWSTRTPKLQIYCVVSQLTTHMDGIILTRQDFAFVLAELGAPVSLFLQPPA